MFKISSYKDIAAKLNRKFARSISDFNPPFNTFSIMCLVYYSLFYFPWLMPSGTQRGAGPESLILRLIAILLCLGLLLRKKWPKKSQEWFPVYWYITLTYCLPFFFSYLFLLNTDSELRLMAFTSIIFWLVLLVDLRIAFILLFLGIGASVGIFLLEKGFFPIITSNIYNILAVYSVFLILIGFLVRNKKRLEREKKLRTAEAVSHAIAHEIRTPLSCIIGAAGSLKKYFPGLLTAYQLAKENNLPGLKIIPPRRFELLATLSDDIEREGQFANVFIDMLLCNVKQQIVKQNEKNVLKISDCIHKALQDYPFSGDQQSLVHWDDKKDFSFIGSEYLVVHLLMNLLKNSLYYILAASKGQIDIGSTEKHSFNILHFKDTGRGISKAMQDMLFQELMGYNSNKVGLGLAFCAQVMRELGGRIECHSVEGEFSEFLLYFPRIKGQ